MARRASVRWWESRNGYFATIKGKQVQLGIGPDDRPDGPNYTAAGKRFEEITQPRPDGPVFRMVVVAYLAWHSGQHPPTSTRAIRERLDRVLPDFGSTPVSSLTARSLEKWAAGMREKRGWGNNTIRMTLSAVRACLRFAEEDNLIRENPVRRLRLPPPISRSDEVVLSQGDEVAVFASTNSATAALCIILRDTGCRPGEAARAEKRHFVPELRALVFPARPRVGPSHKTAGKTGKPRIIYLRGESLALVQRLCEVHPTGPLLRTRGVRYSDGRTFKRCPWTPGAIGKAFARLRRRSGVKGLIAYSFRHTFATRWLRAGRNIDALAELMGTSRKVIEDTYGHLAQQTDYLRGLVDGLDREAKQ